MVSDAQRLTPQEVKRFLKARKRYYEYFKRKDEYRADQANLNLSEQLDGIRH